MLRAEKGAAERRRSAGRRIGVKRGEHPENCKMNSRHNGIYQWKIHKGDQKKVLIAKDGGHTNREDSKSRAKGNYY